MIEDMKGLTPVTPKPTECEDAVSRQAALKAFEELPHEYKTKEQRARTGGIAACQFIVRELPPVTPKQRTGKWNDYYTSKKGNDVFNCKLCGATFIVTQGEDNMNYCPNCGAKMEGESE